MFLEFSKYYFIKSSLKKLPKAITDGFSLNDDLILSLASFNTLGGYYRILNPFIRDSYRLDIKLMDENIFNKFMLECLYIIKREDKMDKLLFFYAMILNYIHDKHLISYINAIKDPKLSLGSSMNMIDFYLAQKYDDLDLSRENLYKKYPKAFKLPAYAIELVHQPLLKVCMQFSSPSMLDKCSKRRAFIYRFMVKPNWVNKAILSTHDFIFRFKDKYRLKDLLYLKKLDTRLLNLSKNEYEIDGIKYNNTLDDVIGEAKREAILKLNALNDYLFNNHDKQLRREFNISDDINLDD